MDSLDSQPVTDTKMIEYQCGLTAHQAVERRLLWSIVILLSAGTLAAALFGSQSLAIGTLLGGSLSLINFKWLAGSLRGLFELNLATGNRKTPPGTMMKFVLRWLLIGAVSYAASRTGFFGTAGIVAGLLAPAAAIIVEAGYTTYKTLTEGEAV